MMNELSLFDFLIVFLKKKRLIIVNFFVISCIALGIGLSLKPSYKSTVRFIPQGSGGGSGLFALVGQSISADVVGDLPFSKRQYMTILSSSSIKREMIDTFNLISHYKLKGDDLVYRADKILSANITVSAEEEGGLGITEVLSVTISVVDSDRELAAEMANFLYRRMEKVVLDLHHKNYNDLSQYLSKEVKSYQDSLALSQKKLANFMHKNKVYSINKQTEMVLQLYGEQKAKLISINDEIELRKKEYSSSNQDLLALEQKKMALESSLKKMETNKSNDVFVGLENSIGLSEKSEELYVNVEVYSQLCKILLQQLKQAQIKGSRDYSGLYLLEKAEPALYKYKPKRAFVILGIVSAYMFVLLVWILFSGLISKALMEDEILHEKVSQLKNALKL